MIWRSPSLQNEGTATGVSALKGKLNLSAAMLGGKWFTFQHSNTHKKVQV